MIEITTQTKFELLVDLGTIVVPDDYVHKNQLKKFHKKNGEKFYYYNDSINDKNFPNPSRVLKPDDALLCFCDTNVDPLALENSGALTLDLAIQKVKDEGYTVVKII